MNNTDEEHTRGWNRRGFRYDRNSDEYKKYKARLLKTRYNRVRQRLTELAKSPVKRSNKKKII